MKHWLHEFADLLEDPKVRDFFDLSFFDDNGGSKDAMDS
jgi:hypothetical protein